jgi:UDP-N-acetylglucosamine diphosphorylase/glucosamine-1-phosphate N-acetyltransferase
MRVCLFEDKAVEWLEPLTLARPAFDLWCGAMPLWQRQVRAAGATEVAASVRIELAELCQLNHPNMAVNSGDLPADVFINARWLPGPEPLADFDSPRVALIHDDVAFAILPEPATSGSSLDRLVETWKHTLPQVAAAGCMIEYPWDLVEHNSATLCQDWEWFKLRAAIDGQETKACSGTRESSKLPGILTNSATTNVNKTSTGAVSVVGPADRLVIAAGASVDPFVVADTRGGPVLIDKGAVIHAFSRLEGPCYVGEGSWILGAKLRGGTIGPHCRIGGEVESSIVHGHSNKYHDGFLGHSYVGEWVNLAAGTHTSDLRNDYGTIKMMINGERLATGLTKVGSYIGDHTKTGLNTLLNTGTAIGPFCNVLPTGTYSPATIPSFCIAKNGQMQERTDLRQLFNTASTVLRRRGQELTGAHIDFFFSLYDQTAPRRRKLLRDLELRRFRQSV